MSVSGDTVVVGAYGESSSTTGVNSTPNENASYSGAAYVFVRNGTAWSQQAYLKAHQVTAGDYFGTSVSVSGETVVAGAPGESTVAFSSGAAYVFSGLGVPPNPEVEVALEVISSGGMPRLRLTWPAVYLDVRVFQSPLLGPLADWTDTGLPPVLNGGQLQVEVQPNPANPQMFYRLTEP